MKAAQGSEPELCIPISVVAPEPQEAANKLTTGGRAESAEPQIILCGDRYQRK